jgi:hypothetical protein
MSAQSVIPSAGRTDVSARGSSRGPGPGVRRHSGLRNQPITTEGDRLEQHEQYVGVELHWRRSVIVRRSQGGEIFDSARTTTTRWPWRPSGPTPRWWHRHQFGSSVSVRHRDNSSMLAKAFKAASRLLLSTIGIRAFSTRRNRGPWPAECHTLSSHPTTRTSWQRTDSPDAGDHPGSGRFYRKPAIAR